MGARGPKPTPMATLAIERVAIASLSPDPANARRHGSRNLGAIEYSLRTFGQRKPIVVRNGVVIAGNGTLEAARLIGWAEIDIVRADDLTEDQAAAFAVADNRTAELAEWDNKTLASLLAGLPEGADVAGIGFSDADIAGLIDPVDEFISAPKSSPVKPIRVTADIPARIWLTSGDEIRARVGDILSEYGISAKWPE